MFTVFQANLLKLHNTLALLAYTATKQAIIAKCSFSSVYYTLNKINHVLSAVQQWLYGLPSW